MGKNIANLHDVHHWHVSPDYTSGYYAFMDSLLRYAHSRQAETVAFLREMVECESPSDDPAALGRFAGLFAARVSPIAAVSHFGPHFRCEFDLPVRAEMKGQILALGHADTVWPLGTLRSMPWRETEGRLWGPGVLDMKAGLAFFVTAMRSLRDLNIPVDRKVVLQVNADEEVGSETSRPLTEAAARESDFVLVLEPGTGLEGKWKTARKGVGGYTVEVRGKAAHAGVDFTAGASAILELARQLQVIAGFTDLERGLTVNPGIVAGGTRTNVIAADARAEVDVRVARLGDAGALDAKFRALKPFDSRCAIEVTGGLNRPPMERTPQVEAMFRQAQGFARELGITLEESSTGGGSDGNFTAALGVPTLDGIGAVGEGAHAPSESILIERIADRTAMLAKLVASLDPAA
jgi:glutamate carboxypeptidase